MGLVFNIPQKVDAAGDPRKAVQQLWKYVTAMQEQLEYTLLNLDSSNVKEISTTETKITSGTGSDVLNGDMISLKSGKYQFLAGLDKSTNSFLFELTDGSGNKVLYFSNGILTISRRVDMTIDGGVW